MKLSYRWSATLVIALGLLMAVLDSTIVSVVLPQIAAAFQTNADGGKGTQFSFYRTGTSELL